MSTDNSNSAPMQSIHLVSKSIHKNCVMICGLAVAISCSPLNARAQSDQSVSRASRTSKPGSALLWSDPGNIGLRDLYYGDGGKRDAPKSTNFTFEKEDLHGTSTKFDVRDDDGTEWRIKLGEEARPETVATRLLWAVGYFSTVDYFSPEVHVADLGPVKRKKRARGLIDEDGTMRNAELRRDEKDVRKAGTWDWKQNPFAGTRELNGLRVMMAVLNNWDLKDENNEIYAEGCKKFRANVSADKDPSNCEQMIYLVSDVGASFGTTGRVRNRAIAKGNLNSYQRSKFIRRVTPQYVDFNVPSRESWILVVNPKEYISRLKLRWIGRHIPRDDARWLGELLGQLSQDQIRDAFRAANYPSDEIDGYTTEVEKRIDKLRDL